jgi:hypothetical protein
MGIQTKTRDEIKKETVTKIHGQPTSQDLTILEKEIIAILANIPTTLGGGNHGHIGIIMEPTEYSTMSVGIIFTNPLNPGFYPATLAATAAAGIRAKAEAEHKEIINQYKTFKGVRLGTKDLILEAVENKYLIEIECKTLGFLNKTLRQMIKHLLDRGGALNFANTKNLIAKRDGEWNINKNPQIYFNRVEMAMKSLAQNEINSDLNEQKDMALYHLKETGEFDAAVCKWEQ